MAQTTKTETHVWDCWSGGTLARVLACNKADALYRDEMQQGAALRNSFL